MTTTLVDRAAKFDIDDLDHFEARVEAFCAVANPDQLVSLINKATAFMEKMAENSGPNTFRFEGWTHFNNASSAINTAARALKDKIGAL